MPDLQKKKHDAAPDLNRLNELRRDAYDVSCLHGVCMHAVSVIAHAALTHSLLPFFSVNPAAR